MRNHETLPLSTGLSVERAPRQSGRLAWRLAMAFLVSAILVLALALGGCKTTSKQAAQTSSLQPPPPSTDTERLGDQYMANNMAQAAIPQFEKALAAGAPKASASWRLGNAYFALKKWPEALEAFRMAIAADPRMAIAHEGAGYASFELGRFDEATLSFEQAAELAPTHWVPHAFLTVLYRLQDKRSQAMAEKDKTLALAGEENKLMAGDTIRRALNRALALRERGQDVDPAAPVQDLAQLEARDAGAGAPAARTVPRKTPDTILDPLSSDMEILDLDTPPSNPAAYSITHLPSRAASQEKSGKPEKAPAAAAAHPEPAGNATDLRPSPAASGNATAARPVAPAAATGNATAASAGANATAGSGTRTAAAPASTVESARKFASDHGNATAGNATATSGASGVGAADKSVASRSAPAEASSPQGKSGAKESSAANATVAPSSRTMAPASPPAAAPVNATPALPPSGGEYVVSTPVLPASLAKAANKQQKEQPPTPAPASLPAAQASTAPVGTSEKPEKPASPSAAVSNGANSQPARRSSPTPGPGEAAVYSLLESSWKSKDRAVQRANELRQRGVDAKLMEADLGAKGLHYRVMIGSRQHREDIVPIKSELHKRFGLGELVILRVRPGDLIE
ncbi:tetratricopeptide repeat protein [Megalodesulfovibrio paquesii]